MQRWVLPRQSIAGFSRWQFVSSHRLFETRLLSLEGEHDRHAIRRHLFSGHRHTWGLMSTEMQGRVVWMCRARGFKDFDEYETVKGFEVQRLGHTITAVFEPDAVSETGFISCFAEPQVSAEFLTCKRGR